MSCLLADAIVVTCFRIFIFESIIEIITTIIYKLEVVWCVAGIEKRYIKNLQMECTPPDHSLLHVLLAAWKNWL